MSWIKDVVQEMVNYEVRIKQLSDEMLRLREANKLLKIELTEALKTDEDKSEGGG